MDGRSNVRDFREWVIERLRSAPARDLSKILGTDSVHPQRELSRTRRHLELLLTRDDEELAKSLEIANGESEVLLLAIRLAGQMKTTGQGIGEAASILRAVARDDRIPRQSLSDASQVIHQQLRNRFVIKLWRRRELSCAREIIGLALVGYPEAGA